MMTLKKKTCTLRKKKAMMMMGKALVKMRKNNVTYNVITGILGQLVFA